MLDIESPMKTASTQKSFVEKRSFSQVRKVNVYKVEAD